MIADFWFDPSCPYTWLTSRWLVEVTRVRPVEARWHVFSLAVLNEGRDDDPEGDPEGYLWVPARIAAVVADRYGQETLGRFYTALWTTGGQDQDWIGDLRTALTATGLPADLAEAGLTDEHDHLVRASHAEGMALIGGDVGTPVVAVSGAGAGRVVFFGPVLSRVPEGEQAGRLWDGTLLVAGTPHFHELKGMPREEPRLP
ncbi:disulfide bond formation protein DsbA [Nonomuraea sp. MCN248]|uniref:Disulfide bond formation protein DsbA n=1 Tax=Nonomuraea corallina TaxID=2989783 RepID=A0ABT4SKL0_9ACTN|nr:disulfide bond formation protein DsbA [Nonomuraea corallina]MDA0637764.1 disulfide bond formation protein DsbA [Nonomuraea corallina]